MKFVISFFLALGFSIPVYAQVYSDLDVGICNSKFELAVKENLADKPINEIISEIGKSFLGTKYEAFAIEKEGKEQLVINLNWIGLHNILRKYSNTFSLC